MNEEEGFQRFREIIATELKVDIERVVLEASFVEDLRAEELDVVQLTLEWEDAFGIEFGHNDVMSIRTVGDAWRIIQQILKT